MTVGVVDPRRKTTKNCSNSLKLSVGTSMCSIPFCERMFQARQTSLPSIKSISSCSDWSFTANVHFLPSSPPFRDLSVRRSCLVTASSSFNLCLLFQVHTCMKKMEESERKEKWSLEWPLQGQFGNSWQGMGVQNKRKGTKIVKIYEINAVVRILYISHSLAYFIVYLTHLIGDNWHYNAYTWVYLLLTDLIKQGASMNCLAWLSNTWDNLYFSNQRGDENLPMDPSCQLKPLYAHSKATKVMAFHHFMGIAFRPSIRNGDMASLSCPLGKEEKPLFHGLWLFKKNVPITKVSLLLVELLQVLNVGWTPPRLLELFARL